MGIVGNLIRGVTRADRVSAFGVPALRMTRFAMGQIAAVNAAGRARAGGV